MAEPEFTDAIAMLKADHRKVEDLFAKFESARGESRMQSLATQICNELKVHTMLEEEIFYPALKGKIEDDLLNEAYVEHDGAKVLINDILGAAPDEFFEAKIKVLSEEIEHHVKEEEESGVGMFAQARSADVDLVALRDAMLARKAELMPQAEANELPEAETRTIRE